MPLVLIGAAGYCLLAGQAATSKGGARTPPSSANNRAPSAQRGAHDTGEMSKCMEFGTKRLSYLGAAVLLIYLALFFLLVVGIRSQTVSYKIWQQ